MHDVGFFRPQHGGELARRVAGSHRIEAPAFGLERDDAGTRRLDDRAVGAHPRDNRHIETEFASGSRHRQKMRREEPVLRHDEDELAARKGARKGVRIGARGN